VVANVRVNISIGGFVDDFTTVLLHRVNGTGVKHTLQVSFVTSAHEGRWLLLGTRGSSSTTVKSLWEPRLAAAAHRGFRPHSCACVRAPDGVTRLGCRGRLGLSRLSCDKCHLCLFCVPCTLSGVRG
jgi:hypothetical protein